MNILFPAYESKWGKDAHVNTQYHRYYPIHFKYFLNLLKNGGCHIEEVPAEHFKFKHKTAFEFEVEGDLCLVDFSDFQELTQKESSKYKAVFKFHYDPEIHSESKNIYSFSPVNFHNWDLYNKMTEECTYKAKGIVLNNQSPAGNALKRRTYVRAMLNEHYGNEVDTRVTGKESFFKKVNDCLVSVCVPGARNNMLDRGQAQYMFLGACTISPKLVTKLSYNRSLEPNIHYVECKSDYSDLIEKIEWCRNNTGKCIKIGNNARRLMMATSTPNNQVNWIKKCLSDEI